ncbi:MAG: molybdopterin molybdotransferase MoeA [Mucilaginibacter sp.]
MITVEEAEKLIAETITDFGAEIVPFELSVGRVLAETIITDRDLPPFNRSSMDGIAISYNVIEKGVKTFKIKAVQAAGDQPVDIDDGEECVEIMTGAALATTVNTVVRYEDVEIQNGYATITTSPIKKGQNIHRQGADKKKGDIILLPGRVVDAAVINSIASVGEAEIRVKRHPRVVIISSGDELVDVAAKPSPYQIRKSNSYTMQAILSSQGITAAMLHIPDDADSTKKNIQQCLHSYDVILLCGGISMGKFDYIPQALKELEVTQVFHKVQQRPGKPFWFGKHDNGVVVFAFPGNPVATFMCMHRYFMPWLQLSNGQTVKPPVYAVLNEDFIFKPQLQYFLQVKLNFNQQGQLLAMPIEGNGSGDFANLADTDAFMELPSEKSEFKMGEVYRIWPFNQLW